MEKEPESDTISIGPHAHFQIMEERRLNKRGWKTSLIKTLLISPTLEKCTESRFATSLECPNSLVKEKGPIHYFGRYGALLELQ